MRKLILFLLACMPSAAFAVGGGGINLTPNLISFIRAIAVLQNGTLLGGASYFNFTGAGCTASVNGATATINCTGGGGVGGSSGSALYALPYGVAISTINLPKNDFNLISDGSGSSTMTVKNASGTWTAWQRIENGSWTVINDTFAFQNGFITFGTDVPKAMITFSSGAGSTDLIMSASSGSYEYFHVNSSSWFLQGKMFVVGESTAAGGMTIGGYLNSRTIFDNMGSLAQIAGNEIFFNGINLWLKQNGEANIRNSGTSSNNILTLQTDSLINGHIYFRQGGGSTIRDSFNADGALVVGGATTTAGNVQLETIGGIVKISSDIIVAGSGTVAGPFMSGTGFIAPASTVAYLYVSGSSIATANYTAVLATAPTAGQHLFVAQVNGSNIVIAGGGDQAGSGSGNSSITDSDWNIHVTSSDQELARQRVVDSTTSATIQAVYDSALSSRTAYLTNFSTITTAINNLYASDLSSRTQYLTIFSSISDLFSNDISSIMALGGVGKATDTLAIALSQRTEVTYDEGSPLVGGDIRAFNFVGSAVSASQSGSTVTVTITGTGASVITTAEWNAHTSTDSSVYNVFVPTWPYLAIPVDPAQWVGRPGKFGAGNLNGLSVSTNLAAATIADGDGLITLDYIPFAASTRTYAHYQTSFSSYDWIPGSTIAWSYSAFVSSGAGAGKQCKFCLQAASLANGALLTSAVYGTSVCVNIPNMTTNLAIYNSTVSASITIGGNAFGGNRIVFRDSRQPQDGDDNFGGATGNNVNVAGVTIYRFQRPPYITGSP